MDKTGWVPSNQHLNHCAAGGDEEDHCLLITKAGMSEMEINGHPTYLAYIPGTGYKSTDELDRMLDGLRTNQCTGAISVHSNVGSNNLEYMYPQLNTESDRVWAEAMARDAAIRTGFRYHRGYVNPRISLFRSHTRYMGTSRAILMEVGEHVDMKAAAYLHIFHTFLGIQLARSYMTARKMPYNNGPIAANVLTPSDVKSMTITSPLMRGPDVTLLQIELNRLGERLVVDGIYGRLTHAARLKWVLAL